MERSSIAVLDEAKILLSTPGVTGMRPLDEGGPRGTLAYERFSSDEPVEEAGMSIAVCCASTRLTQVWLAQGYKPVRFMQERKEKKKKGRISHVRFGKRRKRLNSACIRRNVVQGFMPSANV